jgi:hypothetical protein
LKIKNGKENCKHARRIKGNHRKPIVVSAWCRFVGAFAQKAQAILCVLKANEVCFSILWAK